MYRFNKLQRAGWILSLIGGAILTLFGLIAVCQSPLLGYFTITILSVQNLQVGGVATIILGITESYVQDGLQHSSREQFCWPLVFLREA
jgi:hypothetical protein